MGEVIQFFSKNEKNDMELFREGIQFLNQQNHELANKRFIEAAEKNHKNAEFYYYSAITSYLLLKDKEAEEEIKKSISIHKKKEYLHLLGVILYNQGRLKEAFKIFYKMHLKNELDTESAIYLAKCYNYYEKYKESLKLLKKYQILTNRHDILFELGNVYYKMYEYEKAEKCLLSSLKKYKYYHQTYMMLWMVYLAMGDHDKAILVMKDMKEVYPEEQDEIDEKIKMVKMLTNL